jgi:hypothetical protein
MLGEASTFFQLRGKDDDNDDVDDDDDDNVEKQV